MQIARIGLQMGIEMNLAKKIFLIALFAIAQSSCAGQKNGLPEDVSQFVARRDICDHLRGEVPDAPDADFIRQVNDACRGADADLSKLKSKYLKDGSIMAKLSSYEPLIEAQPK